MTPHGALSHQVKLYYSWKKELIRQIGRYRLWLQDNRLYSDDISKRIHEGLRLLKASAKLGNPGPNASDIRRSGTSKRRQTCFNAHVGTRRANAGARHLEPIPFQADRHVIAIRKLRQKSERFRSNPHNVLTERSVLVQRFSNLMINEVRNLYQTAQKDAERWPRHALLPVMQYTLEQKQRLQHQSERLKELACNDRHDRAETKRLEDAIIDLQRQLELAEAIHQKIRKPAPTLSQQKAVNLSNVR
jgi:hypothetical protein